MRVSVFDQYGTWRRDFSDVRKVSYNDVGICTIEQGTFELDINPRFWGYVERHNDRPAPPIAATTAVRHELPADETPFLIPHTGGNPRRLPDALAVRRAMQTQCACDVLRCPVRDEMGRRCHLGDGHEFIEGAPVCLFNPPSPSLIWQWGPHNHHEQCPRHPSRYNRGVTPLPKRDPALVGYDSPLVETPRPGTDETQPIDGADNDSGSSSTVAAPDQAGADTPESR